MTKKLFISLGLLFSIDALAAPTVTLVVTPNITQKGYPLTLTATVTGEPVRRSGEPSILYSFRASRPGCTGTVDIAIDSTKPSVSWTPAIAARYSVVVYARDNALKSAWKAASAPVAVEVWQTTSVNLAITPPPPNPAIGDKFQATASVPDSNYPATYTFGFTLITVLNNPGGPPRVWRNETVTSTSPTVSWQFDLFNVMGVPGSYKVGVSVSRIRTSDCELSKGSKTTGFTP